MKPDILEVKDRLGDLENHFLFIFQGQSCGVDPISRNQYNMWFGKNHTTVSCISEVFEVKFWDGASLDEIFDSVEIEDF